MDMKRRHFLGTLAVGGLGGALAPAAVTEPDSPLVRFPLALMAPRSDGFEAVWAVNRLSRGRIEWRTDGASGFAGADAFGFVPQGDNILRVKVSGLRPGTNYQVRSHTLEGTKPAVLSEWKPFRTLDPRARTAHFAMWSDTHIHDDTIRALHRVTPAVDFLVWNGDTCRNTWDRPELLAPTLLHPGECDFTVNRPVLFNWGNHDCRGLYAFQMPAIAATPSGRPFYAFRAGPVAVICLNTGEDKPDDHPSFGGRVAFDALRAEQARWLAETIRQPELRDAPYRVVFCHIPLRWTDESPQDYAAKGYDRHSGRSRAAWHDSLTAWHAQAIISGHNHTHAWLPPTAEFPYGQLVGGGPSQEIATWLEGVAGPSELRLKLHALDGKVAEEIKLNPLA